MENYEIEIEKNKKENEKYLNDFANYLEERGFSKKTIANHLSNVDFYINDYLNYYDPQSFDKGCSGLGGFLGDWFIRKALWSSTAHIKSNAASIKKFYKFMLQQGKILKGDYEHLCNDIKMSMSDWLDTMVDYDNMVFDEW